MLVYIDRMTQMYNDIESEMRGAISLLRNSLDEVEYKPDATGHESPIYSKKYHQYIDDAMMILRAIIQRGIIGGHDYTDDLFHQTALNDIDSKTDNPEVVRLSNVFRDFIDKYWFGVIGVASEEHSDYIYTWDRGVYRTIDNLKYFINSLSKSYQRFADQFGKILKASREIVNTQVM